MSLAIIKHRIKRIADSDDFIDLFDGTPIYMTLRARQAVAVCLLDHWDDNEKRLEMYESIQIYDRQLKEYFDLPNNYHPTSVREAEIHHLDIYDDDIYSLGEPILPVNSDKKVYINSSINLSEEGIKFKFDGLMDTMVKEMSDAVKRLSEEIIKEKDKNFFERIDDENLIRFYRKIMGEMMRRDLQNLSYKINDDESSSDM